MTTKILNENIEGLEGYKRIEENHKISIVKKEVIEEEPELFNDYTICGFPFDENSYGCRTCDNMDYCKSQNHTITKEDTKNNAINQRISKRL